MSRVLDELRRAVEKSERSRYEIANATGIDKAQLSRWMNGKTILGLAKAEALAEFLGLELVLQPRKKRRKN